MGWRPIETAPKKKAVMVKFEDTQGSRDFESTCIWDKAGDEWVDVEERRGFQFRYVPTHWMPLPEPPNG